MPERHLLPFALPHGRTGDTGRLTVYFSPRLKDPGPLSDYPEWLDWPATLAGRNLQVWVDGAKVADQPVGVAPSSAVWTAVFAPDTPVAPHRFVDYSNTPLLPMATSDFSEAVLRLYTAVAREYPTRPPKGAELVAMAEAAVLATGNGGPVEPGSLAEADRYRAPMANAVEYDEDNPPPPPEFDFHAAVSLLGHHPELLRWLGLAVDLEVSLPANPTSVRIRINYTNLADERWTAQLVTHTTPEFLALPNPDPDLNEQADGFLTLADDAFLSIVDPHLAASRLATSGDLADERDDGTLPALATRALTLVRPNLVKAYANRTQRQAELEDALKANRLSGGPPVELFAEDLTIGQRIDVLDRLRWRSLFERQSANGYGFPDAEDLAIVPVADEGWNTTLLVTEQDDIRPAPNLDRDDPIEPIARFRLDDALYRWDGWSGAVPSPGGVLDGVTGERAEADPNDPTPEAANGRPYQPAQVAVTYRAVPGTLPRLRFGRSYRMRARCVDLSGVSVDLAAKPPESAIVPVERFGRLEPVAAPVAVRRSPRPIPGVGDTPVELVLRSEHNTEPAEVAPTDRLLFPGRVAQDLCELHGLPEGGADVSSYRLLARRDGLDLTDQTIEDPVSGELVAAIIGIAGVIPGPKRQVVRYLPDPAAVSATFSLPAIGPDVSVPLPGEWPNQQALRIEMVSGADAAVERRPDRDTDVRVVVPQAEIVPVDVSFAPGARFIEHFGLWHQFTPEEQASLRDTILAGRHWMFTPARSLTLVHAVHQPLQAPAVVSLAGDRSIGSSAIALEGVLTVHRKSTERVTLTATWTDTVDDLAFEAPMPRSAVVELGELLVSRSDDTILDIGALRSELHDTKRHMASIAVEAFTSFASYFTEEATIVLSETTVPIDGRGVVAGGVTVTNSSADRAAVAGVDFTVDGPNGTLSLVERGGLSIGDEVTVRYVPLPISRTSAEHVTDEQPAFQLLVPNTIAPPLPAVAEVVPAFARQLGKVVAHSGHVLRIYLDRPWLVTGDGELLAVVLDAVTAPAPGISCVGRDPITPGPTSSDALTVADFPRAVTTAPAVDDVHDVAGHAVEFDPHRGQWFADIELSPTAMYRPFVRLTVARYQPDSVSGAALSPFVTLDPVRLGVVRSVAVEETGDSVQVTVTGVEHGGIPDLSQRDKPLRFNSVRVTVQETDPTLGDVDLRWAAGDPVTLSRTAADGVTTWTGAVPVPKVASPQRLLIEELEPALAEAGAPLSIVESVVFVETADLT